MNTTIPRRTQVRHRWIGPVIALLTAIVAVLNPAPGQAAAAGPGAVACRLAPRLHPGDAVTLVKGQPNRIREAPGLAAGRTAFSISAGEVWYVLAGPVCQDGMNWFQVGQGDAVGWTSEGTPAEGYYLGRVTRPVTGTTAGVCAANYPTRLAVGMEVSVGDGVRQHIRLQPRKSAPAVAWLPPGQAVTIVGGPTCADGWIWWKIANSAGRVLGWTSEGDEKGYWLFAVANTTAPNLAGTYEPSADSTLSVTFSGDGEAATVSFSDLGADTYPQQNTYRTSAHRVLRFPLTGASRGAIANVNIRSTIACEAGGRATAYGTVGGQRFRITCDAAHPVNTELIKTVRVRLPANTPLVIDLNLETAPGAKGGWGTSPSTWWISTCDRFEWYNATD
jgi:hypothetical protein